MKRWMLALAALALLGLTTNVATAEEPLDATNHGATLQTAVLHADNDAQLDTVGWRHRAWRGGWGWGGWYGSYWPNYGYYGGGYPYYSGYWSYPYHTYSYYPYYGCGGCCY